MSKPTREELAKEVFELSLKCQRLDEYTDQLQAEVAALKALYLPYITDDVKEGM